MSTEPGQFLEFLELSQHQQAFIHALRQRKHKPTRKSASLFAETHGPSVRQSVSQTASHSVIQKPAKNLP